MRLMNKNVGMIEVGIASVAMSVVRQSRMNSRIVSETSTPASSRWNFTSSIDLRMNTRLVVDDLDVDVGGQLLLDRGQQGLHAVGHLDGVGAGLLLNEQADGVLAVHPRQPARLFDRILGPADVLDADRIAVAVGDDQLVEFRGREHPPQGPQHQFARALFDDAAGHFQMLRQDGLPHVFDAQRRRP